MKAWELEMETLDTSLQAKLQVTSLSQRPKKQMPADNSDQASKDLGCAAAPCNRQRQPRALDGLPERLSSLPLSIF